MAYYDPDRQRTVSRRHVEFMNGVESGQADRANCRTEDDLSWYRKVTFDNRKGPRGREITHWLSGYMAGLDGQA